MLDAAFFVLGLPVGASLAARFHKVVIAPPATLLQKQGGLSKSGGLVRLVRES